MFCQAKLGLAVCQNDQPSVTLLKSPSLIIKDSTIGGPVTIGQLSNLNPWLLERFFATGHPSTSGELGKRRWNLETYSSVKQ